jgi:hypothetical protein
MTADELHEGGDERILTIDRPDHRDAQEAVILDWLNIQSDETIAAVYLDIAKLAKRYSGGR